MSGHSHWKQIKIQKAVTDRKKSASFGKILNAISIAARSESNPDFNPHLRALMEKAKNTQVPQENIARSIQKAADRATALEEMLLECYGPGGTAVLITAVTDNSNRTVGEVKRVLKEFGARLAEPGSVRWNFEPREDEFGAWRPKFPQDPGAASQSLARLIEQLESLDDIQEVITNAAEARP